VVAVRRHCLRAVVLSLVLVICASIQPGAETRALAQITAGATVSVLAPTVEVALGGGAFTAARDGQTLSPGDQVRTGSTGVALLTFFDGSETQLTGNTQAQLDASTRGYFQSVGTTVNRVRVPVGVGFSSCIRPPVRRRLP
jgi:hypothetical protein